MKKVVTVIAVLVSMFISTSCKDNRVPAITNHVSMSISVSAEPEPFRKWREQDGVIYFSVTSNGKTGEGWIKYLEGKKFLVGEDAKNVLRSKDFKPTSGVTTEIAVLKDALSANDVRTTNNVRADAERRKFTKPNAEISCLIREKFMDEEIEAMGLWAIVAMHDPIKDSPGALRLLGVYRVGDGRGLTAFDNDPGIGWRREIGLAFSVAQVVRP